MRSFLRPLVLCLAISASWSTAMAERNVNMILGARFLDEFWEPVDSQLSMGVNVDFGKKGWPIHLAVGVPTNNPVRPLDSGT